MLNYWGIFFTFGIPSFVWIIEIIFTLKEEFKHE